jgi:hypothetical protein
MNRRLSSRSASATKIVRPQESTAETQPQLHPALLRLSAIIYISRFVVHFRSFGGTDVEGFPAAGLIPDVHPGYRDL